jgi:hypothetical protein
LNHQQGCAHTIIDLGARYLFLSYLERRMKGVGWLGKIRFKLHIVRRLQDPVIHFINTNQMASAKGNKVARHCPDSMFQSVSANLESKTTMKHNGYRR